MYDDFHHSDEDHDDEPLPVLEHSARLFSNVWFLLVLLLIFASMVGGAIFAFQAITKPVGVEVRKSTRPTPSPTETPELTPSPTIPPAVSIE